MDPSPAVPRVATESLAAQIRRAVLWRSGSQILAQLVQWAATFMVIRLLDPHDYGLFAMSGVVLVFLNMLNGYGLASGLVQAPAISDREVRQVFGMLLAANVALALVQLALAPVAAAYYRQPVVADILRVQSLLYLTTPFVALPSALLSRRMDFRHQARANIVASIASASAALAGAVAGLGVWTLVLAPGVLFATRAVMLTWSARSLVRPSFDFRGAGRLARYGGVMAASQFFWFLQSQADVFIGGRAFPAAQLGLYTTALFLAQIFVSKFVPPLNEVAFSAYARMEGDGAVAQGFLRAAAIVTTAAMPFYMGLATTAEPLVAVVLGAKWQAAAPIVRLIACAMPFMTLQVLLTPACDARGAPGVGVRNGAVGAVLLAGAFAIGARYGPIGLAWAWIAAYPAYLTFSLARALPVIGAKPRALWRAVRQPVAASLAMAAIVTWCDALLPPLSMAVRLAVLVGVGAASYAGWLVVFARPLLRALRGIASRRPVQADWI